MSGTVKSTSRSRLRHSSSSRSTTTVGRRTNGVAKWQLDANGRIANFDMKTLRVDILRRLEGDKQSLYTLEECRTFLLELTRTANAWQEEEIPYLLYLSDLHEKLLPNVRLDFQWPPDNHDTIPLADMSFMEEGVMPIVSKVVDEINRSLIRMIDRLWESRRQRLLFAARLLQNIEPALAEAKKSLPAAAA